MGSRNTTPGTQALQGSKPSRMNSTCTTVQHNLQYVTRCLGVWMSQCLDVVCLFDSATLAGKHASRPWYGLRPPFLPTCHELLTHPNLLTLIRWDSPVRPYSTLSNSSRWESNHTHTIIHGNNGSPHHYLVMSHNPPLTELTTLLLSQRALLRACVCFTRNQIGSRTTRLARPKI
jgi:hypothetical protein